MRERADTRWWRPFEWGVALRQWLEHPGPRREPNPGLLIPADPVGSAGGASVSGPNELCGDAVGDVAAKEDPCGNVNESHQQSASVNRACPTNGPRRVGRGHHAASDPIASLRPVRPSGETDPVGWQAAAPGTAVSGSRGGVGLVGTGPMRSRVITTASSGPGIETCGVGAGSKSRPSLPRASPTGRSGTATGPTGLPGTACMRMCETSGTSRPAHLAVARLRSQAS